MKHKNKKENTEPEAPTSLVSSLISLATMVTKITKKEYNKNWLQNCQALQIICIESVF